MLVHFFWLLEFKFKFEFNWLNPFSKPKTPNTQTSTLSILFKLNRPSSTAAARARGLASAAQPIDLRLPQPLKPA
jgi:hypothetical protein